MTGRRQDRTAGGEGAVGRRFLGRVLLVMGAALGLVGLLALYQTFLARLPRPVASAQLERLDGLVVFTGGPGRVRFAVSLLQQGVAPQLLVTGVDRRVDDATFRQVFGLSQDLLVCCVVLDRTARNTVENAQAAVEWACARGLRRIGVVSTAWHLPRAMVEIERAAAVAGLQLAIRPLAVPGDRRPPYHPRVMREALKLVLALLRARMTAGDDGRWARRCRAGRAVMSGER